MMEQCIKCNTVVVKMKMEMQAILMDHVKIISRIEKFVSTTEANEATSLRADEIKTRQAMDSDQFDKDEVIDLDTEEEEEEYIYECETCYETFENVRGLEKHLEMHHRKKNDSNDVVELENNAPNENEQVSIDENNLESDQNEIEEPSEEQMNKDNFGSNQSEIDEQTDPPIVKARAATFPLLVHELVKGVYEIFGTHGLPDDPRQAEMVLGAEDTLPGEIWDSRLGPIFWEKFTEAYPLELFDEDKKHIQHYLFMRFSKLDAQEFFKVAKLILQGDPKGQEFIKRMVDEIIEELKKYDYEDAISSNDEDEEDDDDFRNFLGDLGIDLS